MEVVVFVMDNGKTRKGIVRASTPCQWPELMWWPNVNGAHVGVMAKDGVVTLSGQVAHYAEQFAAEKAARAVYGVKGIVNDLKVEVPGSSERSDQDIAGAALHALKWDHEVSKDSIKVIVKAGGVTLESSVNWEFQKDPAARRAPGVTSVKDEIVIVP
jgi:osmotically-inducible protein OsmY